MNPNIRKSICFLTRSLEVGGAERQLVLLANLMQADGYDVKIVCMYGSEPLGKDVHRDVELIALNKSGRWDVLSFFRSCYREIKDFNPDYLYSFLVIPNILAILMSPFLGDCKIVWGIRASRIDFRKYDFFTRLTYIFCAFISGSADVRISNSFAGISYAIETGFKEPMEFVPNGIDLQKFYPDEELRGLTRRKLGVDSNSVVMACVGRVDPIKGHETLLQSLSLLMNDGIDFVFFCLGKGDIDYINRLKFVCETLGLSDRIRWLSHYEDMCSFYNAVDVVVSSSHSEGFSNVIVESLACGTLVVATDVGDNKTIIEDQNLISGFDEVSLKETMVRALGIIPVDRHEVRKRIIAYSTDMLLKNTKKAITLL